VQYLHINAARFFHDHVPRVKHYQLSSTLTSANRHERVAELFMNNRSAFLSIVIPLRAILVDRLIGSANFGSGLTEARDFMVPVALRCFIPRCPDLLTLDLFCPTITIDATTLYSAVADFVNSV
jgi:hypothetical protein